MTTALAIIQVVLVLLQGVLQAANVNGFTTIAAAAQGAINELEKVHGTEVTKGQLDSLAVQPSWGPNVPTSQVPETKTTS